ncbi:MAG: hypothetical protein CMM48_00755 [Rhodospirillaceae bacterium]|nr:hypothetical protein [Rhodospirillaceae bacterium]
MQKEMERIYSNAKPIADAIGLGETLELAGDNSVLGEFINTPNVVQASNDYLLKPQTCMVSSFDGDGNRSTVLYSKAYFNQLYTFEDEVFEHFARLVATYIETFKPDPKFLFLSMGPLLELVLEANPEVELFPNNDTRAFTRPTGRGKPMCRLPWSHMELGIEKAVPCCDYLLELEKTPRDFSYFPGNEPLDIRKLWNSDGFKRIRGSRDIRGSFNECKDCRQLNLRVFDPLDTYLFGAPNLHDGTLKPAQIENIEAYINAFWRRDETIEYSPITFGIWTTYRCNIACVHCYQLDDRDTYKMFDFTLEAFESMIPDLEKSLSLYFAGGEFLVSKDARKILNRIAAEPSLDHLGTTIVTNGLLLHHFENDIRSLPHPFVSVSVDGIGEIYNEVRVGSNWNKVERNILALKDWTNSAGEKIDFNVTTVVTASVLPYLEQVINWALSHDITIDFHFPRDLTIADENIVAFDDTRKSVGDYHQMLNRCIEKLHLFGRNEWSTLNILKGILDAREEGIVM